MSLQPVRLIPLLCTRCQAAVPAKPDEVAWVCSQCGQGLLLSLEKGVLPLPVYYSPGLAPNQTGSPFWVTMAQVTLQRRIFGGGDQSADAARFWQTSKRFFVPAYTLTLDQMVELGMRYVLQPPLLQPGPPAAFAPVTLSPEDVQPMAEFIVMGVEANRRDRLKEVQITIQTGAAELWILP